jgi:phage tail-like protein
MNTARGPGPRLPFGNMRFRLEIDMLAEGGATEVVFPEARLQSRGRKAGDARYGPLIIKRGLTASRDWLGWWDAARRDKRAPRRNVRVMLLDDSGATVAAWLFGDVVPVSYQLSSLNALGNEAVIETLELSVGSMEAEAAAKKHR